MGTLWGKGKLGIGRDGTGEEGNRCLVRQKCETLFLLALSLNQQHPWKALSKTRAGAMRQAAQGPKQNRHSQIRAVGEALCIPDSQSLL